MTEAEKAYLAGIIDGEGCVTLVKRRTSGCVSDSIGCYLAVTSTTRPLIDWLLAVCGGRVYEYSARGQRRTHWSWRREGAAVAELLREVMPYLVVKQEQAAIVIAVSETIDSSRRTPDDVLQFREMSLSRIRALHA